MGNICKIKGCNKLSEKSGCCIRHYTQLWRYGKTLKRTRCDPNEIIIKGEIAEIVLYNKKCMEVARAIIDTEDVGKVEKFKWSFSDGYVCSRKDGKGILLHHVVLGVKAKLGRQVDHKDHNGLNNKKSNLRFCTNTENSRNSIISKNNTSGFKGVWWHKRARKWAAGIMVDRKSIHLGLFKDKIKAAKAYNKASIRHFGEFACLNKF